MQFGPIALTGTITSTDSRPATTLTDTGATFVSDGVVAGLTIKNTTDSSEALVTSVDSETVITHGALKDGTDNNWDTSDAYSVDGIPNLQALAKLRAGQSTSSAGNLFPSQEVKDEINLAYEELWWDAKSINSGWGVERSTTLDTVKDQPNYRIETTPGNVDGKIIQVAVELLGKDLTADSTATWTYLTPSTIQVAERGWREGSITSTEFYIYERKGGQERIKILSPPAVTGTNNISLTYEQSLTALSANSDVPIMPPTFHRLIAYLAAVRLRTSRDMEVPIWLAQDVAIGRQKWVEHAEAPMVDLEHSVVSRAWNFNSFDFATRTGFYSRP